MRIPDGFGKVDFTPACRQHDQCYDTCGKPKDFCDTQFRNTLYEQCSKGGGGATCRWLEVAPQI